MRLDLRGGTLVVHQVGPMFAWVTSDTTFPADRATLVISVDQVHFDQQVDLPDGVQPGYQRIRLIPVV